MPAVRSRSHHCHSGPPSCWLYHPSLPVPKEEKKLALVVREGARLGGWLWLRRLLPGERISHKSQDRQRSPTSRVTTTTRATPPTQTQPKTQPRSTPRFLDPSPPCDQPQLKREERKSQRPHCAEVKTEVRGWNRGRRSLDSNPIAHPELPPIPGAAIGLLPERRGFHVERPKGARCL